MVCYLTMHAGIESGDHGGAKALLLSSLLQAVLTDGPMVIAASGVATPDQGSNCGFVDPGCCGCTVPFPPNVQLLITNSSELST